MSIAHKCLGDFATNGTLGLNVEDNADTFAMYCGAANGERAETCWAGARDRFEGSCFAFGECGHRVVYVLTRSEPLCCKPLKLLWPTTREPSADFTTISSPIPAAPLQFLSFSAGKMERAQKRFFDAGQNATGYRDTADPNQPLRYRAFGRADRSSTASVKTTPQGRHSNVCSSGRPPTRGVTRASFIDWPQFGQRGVFAAVFMALFSFRACVAHATIRRQLRFDSINAQEF
jgi:hypothetical protein